MNVDEINHVQFQVVEVVNAPVLLTSTEVHALFQLVFAYALLPFPSYKHLHLGQTLPAFFFEVNLL